MDINIPYGDKTIEINLPASNVAGIYTLNPVECGDEKETLKNAIENPINSEPFSEFIKDGTVVIVNDATRPTPTAKILDIIYPELRGRDIRFVVACGTHTPPKKDGLEFIFGKHLGEIEDRIHSHDAKREPFVGIGKDCYGNPHKVSKLVYDAPKIITISSVEPHYFAGFMGGRKSFLPGVASFDTIEKNHSLATSPLATTLNLKDNPVHIGMVEFMKKMGEERVFTIQVVTDKSGKIYRAKAGNIEGAFEECLPASREVSCVRLKEPVDIAVSVAQYPTDIDFYQAQKAIDNAKLVVKSGGAILFVSGCREGVGNRDFIELFERAGSPERAMEMVKTNFKLGYQKSYKLAEILVDKEIWGYTGVDPSVLRSCFMKPIFDLNKRLNEEAKKGKKIAFFPQGNLTVPFVGRLEPSGSSFME